MRRYLEPAEIRVDGPLASYSSGFCVRLSALGYSPLSAVNQLRLMAHLSRWLDKHLLGPEALDPSVVTAYLEERRANGYTCWLSSRGLAPLLGYLADLGVAPDLVVVPVAVVTAAQRLVEDYREYLLSERGLAASTVRYCTEVAERFLAGFEGPSGELDLGCLDAARVGEFVLAECRSRSVGSAKIAVTGLRSLLRFLHLQGHTRASLVWAVPAVAGWRGSSLSKALPRGDVVALLASCDRARPVGRRDFAILTLLSRLGLRAGEVAALNLSDLDWRTGEVVVRGKGAREERLPLPVDVGEAIVAYLSGDRARGAERALFLRVIAPGGPITRGGVSHVVRDACGRAGLEAVGAHRLRHSAATEMLRAGATLADVGQVLRHRSLATTALYAKVDLTRLRVLIRPWPGEPPDAIRVGLASLARRWPGVPA